MIDLARCEREALEVLICLVMVLIFRVQLMMRDADDMYLKLILKHLAPTGITGILILGNFELNKYNQVNCSCADHLKPQN